jgi:hypothetical protein
MGLEQDAVVQQKWTKGDGDDKLARVGCRRQNGHFLQPKFLHAKQDLGLETTNIEAVPWALATGLTAPSAS